MTETKNEALELAQILEDDTNEHLPVSRSEIAAMLRSQADEIERLKLKLYEDHLCQCGYDDVCEFARERDQLKAAAKLAYDALDEGVTVYYEQRDPALEALRKAGVK